MGLLMLTVSVSDLAKCKSLISVTFIILFQISNSTFVSNGAKYGGAFYLSGGQSEASIENSSFDSNTATCDGPDIFLNSSTMKLRMPNTSASVSSEQQRGNNHFGLYFLTGAALVVLLAAICIFLW